MTNIWGLIIGVLGFALTLVLPAPAGMGPEAWSTAGLVWWMAAWWMTQAVPLTVTALLPFIVLPLTGVMSANAIASEYYSPILFLILGGAFLALAIERVGLHKRLALAIINRSGHTTSRLLLAFMIATAVLSMLISNTSTALIMVPIASAVLLAGGLKAGETEGLPGALMMGIAFAASIGGLGTLVGSPTNAIAAGLLEKSTGLQIGFAEWAAYGLPIVILGIPIAAFILARVQRLAAFPFDVDAARSAIARQSAWSVPERRLMPVIGLVVGAWILQPWLSGLLPAGALTDGSIAVIAGIALFILPDGTGRPMLVWPEANRAPWDVIMMFGGGLALAAGIGESGLDSWIGTALEPLAGVPLIVVALTLTGLVILVTEFASNVATASGVMPVVAALIVTLGVDPVLLAMPVAMAASWGFMLPSGTGPNAIAWASGNIALPRQLKAGLLLDIAGVPLMVGTIWAVSFVIS
ncbi:DASS family sodium-coupled anion symporter [Blastomonas sp.]|uniref:SLC13 family permease n=1 Tax=Blastomonas sp. TaxID=1909299 RepID=UPI00261A27D7|nr:DASS family sodium-coupled anion symporter [Blastomonas sp.]MDM7957280.1 DASS family sodium-coupled anion symporter [Blastomonas sp.]